MDDKPCPNCGGPTAEGSFIAFDGDFILDAWRCLPCVRIFDKKDFDEVGLAR